MICFATGKLALQQTIWSKKNAFEMSVNCSEPKTWLTQYARPGLILFIAEHFPVYFLIL